MDRLDTHYVHGTKPEEQLRLSTLNELLNVTSLRALDLRGGERILDVGCGLAQFTRCMARAAGPEGAVLGVDGSAEQLAEARRQARAEGEEQLIELRQADVLELPLGDEEWGSFDLAHARFLLEHVGDPLRVVRSMVRAVRPGGRVVLEDDDHDVLRVWPELPVLLELWHAYIESYEQHHRDPRVGRRLVSLLHETGAAPRRNSCLFFGSCAGSPDFDDMIANFVGVLEGARRSIVSAGLVDDSRFEDGIRQARDWARRPDAALWYTRSWAEGVRPG
jgi:ubiquinone/menaquinone biosynthesis C-methylase UbiE